MSGTRATVASVIVFLVAAVVAWRFSDFTPPAANRPSPPPPASRAKPPPDAPDAGAPPVTETPVNEAVSAGFCPPDGEEKPVTIHHTLPGFLAERARDPSLDPATRAVVRAALGIARGDASDVHRRAEALRSDHGDSATLAVVRAEAARVLERADLQREALRAAFRLAPDDPAIAWATADAFRHAPDIALASRALASYLRHAENEPALSRLLARLEVERDIEADYRTTSRDGVALLFPPDALDENEAEQLLSKVVADLDEASRLVGAERRAALTVIVYPGREEILAVTCVKSWAAALYDGSLRVSLEKGHVDLDVLRHETLHAALSPTAPDAPQWFDEGVAQYFAHEDDSRERRWALMVKNRSWIPFSSLDGTFQIFDARDDVSLAYAQSLAMVEFLVDRGGRGAIARATELFRTGHHTNAVFAEIFGHEVTGDDFLAYLATRVHAP